MSGEGSSNGSGRGMGRGAIMQQLLKIATQSHTSSDDAKSPTSTNLDRPACDSGFETKSHSPQLTGSHGLGRGALHKLISSSSSSQSPNTTGVSLGRAARLKLSASDSISDIISETPTIATASTGVVSLGRGNIYANLEMLAKQKAKIQEVQIEKPSTVPEISEKMKDITLQEKELEPVVRHGKSGMPISVVSNYITLTTDADKGIFEYDVKYEPSIHAINLRHRLLNRHKNIIGTTKTFDGKILYLPIRLPNENTMLTSKNENDDTDVNIYIVFKRQKRLSECTQLYNILFDRIMKILNYVRFGRKQFDPTAPKIIPQHKLEVWPGYVTAVDEYEGGVMLCLDVSHRLLCQTTVLEYLRKIYESDPNDFQRNAQSALLGTVIITRYNNRTYRIDDIKFDSNPMATFKMSDQSTVSYIEYYKSQYNIDIKDCKQPLLIHSEERRVVGKEQPEIFTFALIPEICYLTGLTDVQRADFRLMRDIATCTRVSPNQRVQSLKQFCKNVNATAEARDILKNWGLTLDTEPVQMKARQLPEEEIIFANNIRVPAGRNGDFNKYITNTEAIDVINISNWLVMYTKRDTNYAKSFITYMEKNSRPMGITVLRPITEVLNDDKTETYVQKLRQLINPQLQIIVIICPTSRDDRYAAIKKICCAELPIPSQVINSKTLSNESKNRAIVQKIALQMNCKLGGSLWSIKIPFNNVMICGIDTYHDTVKKNNSVGAFVASLNSTYTRWYSKACIQNQKEELINGLCSSVVAALNTYFKVNNKLPDRIIIFRDGVGDGQLKSCREYEIPQLLDACRIDHPGYTPGFTFIVVQKRINTRIFSIARSELVNPDPGCVLDHSITRRYLYDYFLIPQSVRQGTVSPTHYIVVHDSSNFEPDVLQKLSYKLCFLYYNWPGSVRVPASCQYAHKMAFLVGQSLKRQPAEKLCDKLFYL